MDKQPVTRIVKIIQDDVWVDYQHQLVQVALKGALRLNREIKPVVGDHVNVVYINDHPVIDKIYPRRNLLTRPKAANVDIIIIVQSTVEPEFNTFLLDQMLTFYQHLNCQVVVALTKTDVQYSNTLQGIISDYQSMGIKIFDINQPQAYQSLLALCKEQVVCFVGNSGVGKSTLINRIDPQLLLKTQAISKALNRGKHTTTSTSLLASHDFYVIDTPGYSTVKLDFDPLVLAQWFFATSSQTVGCQFNDCLHKPNSINCVVLKNVQSGKIKSWRYENYLRILSELGATYDKNRFK